jgi:hypothetical protein
MKTMSDRWSYVQAMFASVDNALLRKERPCDIHKLANSLKLKKACGLDDIPNECLWHLQRRLLVHLTHLFSHCLRLSHFVKAWKEANVITLPKLGKDPKLPQNLCPISLLSTTGKLFEKVILKIVQRHIEDWFLCPSQHDTSLFRTTFFKFPQ